MSGDVYCGFFAQNWADLPGVRFSATSEVATAPVSKLAEPAIGDRWRTNYATTVTWTLDWLEDRDVDVIMLAFPWDAAMPGVGDTVEHWLDADGGVPGAGAVLGTGAIALDVAPGYGLHIYLPDTTKQARYYTGRMVVPSMSPVPGYLDTGRFLAGPGIRAINTAKAGLTDPWLDASKVTTAERSGIEYIDVLTKRRVMTFDMALMTEVEGEETFKELGRVLGITQQLLFIPDLAGDRIATQAIYGRLQSALQMPRQLRDLYDAPFQIRQSL